MGAPGVGKGTQAARICAHLGLVHLSVGDILRDNVARQTPIGIAAKSRMDTGKLVSDDIIIQMMMKRMGTDDCANGILLDGFPRTISQATALQEMDIHLHAVIDLKVSDEVVVERLSGRLLHPASGRIYHRVFSPPKNLGVDDETGEPLVQRDDDKEEIILHRLRVYHESALPLQSYYADMALSGSMRLLSISGVQSPDEITKEIIGALEEIRIGIK